MIDVSVVRRRDTSVRATRDHHRRAGLVALVVSLTGWTTAATAQIAPPNEAGVAMGHVHYTVRDVAANVRFWQALGGVARRMGPTVVIRFPGVEMWLDEGESTGGSEGSVVNHVAFRVGSLDDVEAAGFSFERSVNIPGITSVYSPEGERIELFDVTATNVWFTRDDGGEDAVTGRHARPIGTPIVSHHTHLYLPMGSEDEARAWYAALLGGVPGMRWRYPAVDVPGMNLNLSDREAPTAPTRGRMLDHLGFEVTNLDDFCRRLEARGVELDEPIAEDGRGFRRARLTDPWGTSIVLTEGLREVTTTPYRP